MSSHAADPVALVRAQLAATLAALLKRGWADAPPDERRAFFDEVDAAAGSGGPAARRCGLEILEVGPLHHPVSMSYFQELWSGLLCLCLYPILSWR